MKLVALQLCFTSVMVGLIWLIQLVHYPLFAHVGESTFARYHAMHMRQISFIVMPVMLVELALAGWMAWQPPAGAPRHAMWAALACVCIAWGSTALWSVPAHGALSTTQGQATIARLVATNWPRTLAWTAHQGILLWVLWRGLSALESVNT